MTELLTKWQTENSPETFLINKESSITVTLNKIKITTKSLFSKILSEFVRE